ncbi:MAG: hypothetical protein ACO1OQ_08960 [Rufibacter sp.]
MEAQRLKNILIQRIQEINDEVFLQALKVMTDAKVADASYEVNAFEREKISTSRTEYAAGEISDHEQLKADIDEWLKSA